MKLTQTDFLPPQFLQSLQQLDRQQTQLSQDLKLLATQPQGPAKAKLQKQAAMQQQQMGKILQEQKEKMSNFWSRQLQHESRGKFKRGGCKQEEEQDQTIDLQTSELLALVDSNQKLIQATFESHEILSKKLGQIGSGLAHLHQKLQRHFVKERGREKVLQEERERRTQAEDERDELLQLLKSLKQAI